MTYPGISNADISVRARKLKEKLTVKNIAISTNFNCICTVLHIQFLSKTPESSEL